MPEIFVGGTKYEDPRDLLNEYITRLRAADPINTLENSPIQGADQRNVAEMADLFRRLKEDAEKEGAKTQITSKPMREDLDLLFRNRQDYLQSLDPAELKYFGDRLQDWSKESGLSIQNLNNQDFGGLQHETVSHYFPWQKGFSLDTQPKTIEGYQIAANPASPLNELFATSIDRALLSGKPVNLRDSIFSRSGAQELSDFYFNLGLSAATSEQGTRGEDLIARYDRFNQAAQASNPFAVRETPDGPIKAPIKLPPHLADVGLQLDEASKLLNWKFMDPLRQRYENLGKAQAPFDISRDFTPSWSSKESLLSGLGGRDFRELRNLPIEETNYNRMLNLGQNLNYYLSNVSGRTSKYGGGANMLFSADPLGLAIAGARRIPPHLLPGAADLIPSSEAVRAGFRQGPDAMGQQMAQDFIAGLPVSAPLASILSNPAVAPFAPGIGLGLVGSAGAEALNTAVDEATGKPLLQRVQEVAGKAAPGVMGKPERPNRYEVAERFRRDLERIQNPPQIKPATRIVPKPQNELQRRIQMAGQRFNPRRGEFGLTELLFGR